MTLNIIKIYISVLKHKCSVSAEEFKNVDRTGMRFCLANGTYIVDIRGVSKNIHEHVFLSPPREDNFLKLIKESLIW